MTSEQIQKANAIKDLEIARLTKEVAHYEVIRAEQLRLLAHIEKIINFDSAAAQEAVNMVVNIKSLLKQKP